MATLKLIWPLLLLTLVALATAVPSYDENSGLAILSSSPEKLHAIYRTNDDEGIEIMSEINDRHKFVSIMTLDGTSLISAESSKTGSNILTKFLDSTFLQHNRKLDGAEASIMEYSIPSEFDKFVNEELKHGYSPGKIHLLLSKLEDNVNQKKFEAMSKLLARSEVSTIIDTSRALGASGIKGYENAAALQFYGIALNLARAQSHPEFESTDEHTRRITKRATCRRVTKHWSFWHGTVRTSHRDHCNRCYANNDHCTGMCGKKCDCWKWVCGDCCYHQGCYEHDRCCGKHGMFHGTCLDVFNLSCGRHGYRC